MALKQHSDSPTLWHDLGVNYHHQARFAATEPRNKQQVSSLINKAIQSLEKALSIDPNSHLHWNVLGVVAASKGRNLLI